MIFYTNNIRAGALGQPSLPQKTEITTHPQQLTTPSRSPLVLGLGTNFDYININDEQGLTDSKASIQAKSFFIIHPFIYDSRYLAELYSSNHGITAGNNGIGGQADNKGLRFSIQFKTIDRKFFSPWYGIGTGLSLGKYTQRYRTDAEGYLTNEYDDLTKLSINLLFNVIQTWTIYPDVMVGAKIEYRQPLTQAVNGISGSLLLLYRPNF